MLWEAPSNELFEYFKAICFILYLVCIQRWQGCREYTLYVVVLNSDCCTQPRWSDWIRTRLFTIYLFKSIPFSRSLCTDNIQTEIFFYISTYMCTIIIVRRYTIVLNCFARNSLQYLFSKLSRHTRILRNIVNVCWRDKTIRWNWDGKSWSS